MSTAGTFTIIKNEARWIREHLLSWLPHVDQQVFFDGNSTDGTLEIIKDVAANHPFGHRITLVEGKDPADLDKDYQRVFNECLHTLRTDYAIFAHPDMMLDNPGNIGFLGEHLAYTANLRSFAGEPDGPVYEVIGRQEKWKNIYRLKNPDLGLHYFGAYGAWNEDCYFSQITGDSHDFYQEDFHLYPYTVGDSQIVISHYSDVRPYARRYERMVRCLINQGRPPEKARQLAAEHPRVTLKDGHGLRFVMKQEPARV